MSTEAGQLHLLKAVRVVHQGEVWASNRVIALTVAELAALSVNPQVGKLAVRERLSPREQEIVHLVVDGLSNLEAASRLGITEATVKAHLTHIFQKLALRGRAQLAARYHAAFPAPSQGAGGAQPVEHRWKPDPVGARTGREAGPLGIQRLGLAAFHCWRASPCCGAPGFPATPVSSDCTDKAA